MYAAESELNSFLRYLLGQGHAFNVLDFSKFGLDNFGSSLELYKLQVKVGSTNATRWHTFSNFPSRTITLSLAEFT